VVALLMMKVINYREAASRIEWRRMLELTALRHAVLSAVAAKLQRFEPNSPLNIKHPWKPREPFSIRAWCPLHDGRWARLIVRAAEDGQLTFECFRGCSQDDVERAIDLRSVTFLYADAFEAARSTSHAGRVTQPGNSRSSIHTSADGRRRLHLVTDVARPEHEQQSVTLRGRE
jgi:hypothetical protein